MCGIYVTITTLALTYLSTYTCEFCPGMTHRGEILKRAVEESEMKVAGFARKIKYSREHIYRLFKREDVDLDFLLKAGKILQFDFSIEVPELNGLSSEGNQGKEYGLVTTSEYHKTVDKWKTKYLELLEEYNQLLKTKK